jgi:hypothetical protein
MVNRNVLWPLGLALAVEIDFHDPDDEGSFYGVIDNEESIVDPDEWAENAYLAYLKSRMAQVKI